MRMKNKVAKRCAGAVMLAGVLLLSGCGAEEKQDAVPPEDDVTTVSFISGMGCDDPTCTDPSHHHDCPSDCADYDHHHHCGLDCNDSTHHHHGGQGHHHGSAD